MIFDKLISLIIDTLNPSEREALCYIECFQRKTLQIDEKQAKRAELFTHVDANKCKRPYPKSYPIHFGVRLRRKICFVKIALCCAA